MVVLGDWPVKPPSLAALPGKTGLCFKHRRTEQLLLPQIPAASDQTAIDTCKAKAAPLEVEAHRQHLHPLHPSNH